MRCKSLSFPGILATALLLNLLGGSSLPAAEGLVRPGTAAMAKRLKELNAAEASSPNFYRSDVNARILKERWEKATAPSEKLPLQAYLFDQLLNAGETREAINVLEDLKRQMAAVSPQLLAQNLNHLDNRLAVAYLRLGEQENCIHHHGIESCLVPIQGAGFHQQKEGSEKAMEILGETLKREPDNYINLWLLNIAAMTLGQYPDAVDPRWRVPPASFQSSYDIKRFPDIAMQLGIGVNDHSGGSVLDDFNGDGKLDLMVSSWALEDQIHVFLNDGHGGFRDFTEGSGLSGITGGLNLTPATYDNTGEIHDPVLRGAWLETEGNHPNSLLQNQGDGTFEDVTLAAGVFSLHPTQTATWFDYDNDGWLDLFIANESVNEALNPCELFHNNKNGTFTDVAKASGLTQTGFFKAVVSGDYDNDGRTDLYLSRLFGPNLLLRNLGPRSPSQRAQGIWRFADCASSAGVSLPLYSFPAWFWDYDNDGFLDLYVADYDVSLAVDVIASFLHAPLQGETAHLYHNRGDGTFEDVSQQTGTNLPTLAMGANFGDLDNDGWLDFYLGTGAPDLELIFPNRMFRNDGGKTFQDVTFSGGFGHLQKGHAISFGDFDEDGDQDVFAVMGGAITGDRFFNACFQNPGHGNHWIKLKLEGTTSNRSGIGARIKVVATQGEKSREIHRVVSSGGSFGANPLTQHIGLGQADKIASIEVWWPASGKKQLIANPAMDQSLVIREQPPVAGE